MVVSFVKRLLHPPLNLKRDLYACMFLSDFCCFLIVAFSSSSFDEIGRSSRLLSMSYERDVRVPISLIGMLMAHVVVVGVALVGHCADGIPSDDHRSSPLLAQGHQRQAGVSSAASIRGSSILFPSSTHHWKVSQNSSSLIKLWSSDRSLSLRRSLTTAPTMAPSSGTCSEVFTCSSQRGKSVTVTPSTSSATC